MKWLCSCMWHCWNENQHLQNWGTASFEKSCPMFSSSWWSSLKQVKKFKYLGVAFTDDGKQDQNLDIWSSKASAVMRALHHSVVLKRELSRKAKLSVFKVDIWPHPDLRSRLKQCDHKCKRPNCEELKKLQCFTNFENLSTLNRHFSYRKIST